MISLNQALLLSLRFERLLRFYVAPVETHDCHAASSQSNVLADLEIQQV